MYTNKDMTGFDGSPMIERALSDHEVFLIDSCAMFCFVETKHGHDCLERLQLGVLATGKPLCIMEDVLHEIDSHYRGTAAKATPQSMASARLALEMIDYLIKGNYLKLIPRQSKVCFADAALLSYCHANTHALVAVLTLDRDLTADLNALRHERSIKHAGVDVYKITKTGWLKRVCDPSPSPSQPAAPKPTPTQSISKPGAFAANTGKDAPAKPLRRLIYEGPLADDLNLPLNSDIPTAGSVVVGDTGAHYKLAGDIGNGGEAVVYEIDGRDDIVAKIFNRPTTRHHLKIRCLCFDRTFEVDGAVFPTDCLHDSANRFVGYVMPRINGISIEELFVGDTLEREASHFTRRDLVKIALSYVRMVIQLHSFGFMIGDVSPANIMIGRGTDGRLCSDKVFLIDTESGQFGSKDRGIYPASGFTRRFLAPEQLLSDIRLGEKRSISSERFSVMMLSLYILLCGVHPFASIDDDGIDEYSVTSEDLLLLKIANQHFPYGAGKNHRKARAPLGADKIWSYLPPLLKDYLYRQFTCSCEDRSTLAALAYQLSVYEASFDDEDNRSRYAEMFALVPSLYKPYWVVCSECGCTFDAANTRGAVQVGNVHLCPECAAKPAGNCRCGNPLSTTKAQQLRGHKVFGMCSECYAKYTSELAAKASRFDSYRMCSKCCTPFAVTVAEAARITDNAPCICPVCSGKASAEVSADAEGAPSGAPSPSPEPAPSLSAEPDPASKAEQISPAVFNDRLKKILSDLKKFVG